LDDDQSSNAGERRSISAAIARATGAKMTMKRGSTTLAESIAANAAAIPSEPLTSS
jgi:hypothetical protein